VSNHLDEEWYERHWMRWVQRILHVAVVVSVVVVEQVVVVVVVAAVLLLVLLAVVVAAAAAFVEVIWFSAMTTRMHFLPVRRVAFVVLVLVDVVAVQMATTNLVLFVDDDRSRQCHRECYKLLPLF
jgi:hypothetical protein